MTQFTEFKIVPAELGLEPFAKASLELAFTGFFLRAREFAARAETVTDPKDARLLRLEIKADRVATEKVRKSLKEDSLRMGKAIDGANNIYLALVAPTESKLEDIEKAAERKEAARIEALREERSKTLESLGNDWRGISLGTMSDDQWHAYKTQAKDAYEFRKERERKAEEERQAALNAEAESREAQRLENIRLREEGEKAAAELAKEREERAKREADAKAERDAAERKAAAELAKEQSAKSKIEAEAKSLRDAEAKRIADEKAAIDAKAKVDAAAAKKAAAAPDKAKLLSLAERVSEMPMPDLTSESGKAMSRELSEQFRGLAAWIAAKAATL